MADPLLLAILFACGLLAVGFALRVTVRPLQAVFIPASVIGGLIGFAVVQAGLRVPGEGSPLYGATAGVAGTLSVWPGVLIAVVFAGLLLERSGKRFGDAVRLAARQGVVAWIIILGEVAVGVLLTWLLILPFYDVPASFGQLIETGFAGGHGTAGAMGEVFANALDFPPGRDLGFFFATYGLLYGVVSGIVFVNIAVRRGWTSAGDVKLPRISGLENRRDPPPAAWAKVRPEVIDPLVFQVVILAAAFAVGWGLQMLYGWAASALLGADDPKINGETIDFALNVPLFLFTLLGGWVVREIMHLFGIADLIDGESIKRLVATAMEFLIVAAIASLRVEAIAAYLWPVVLLLAGGSLWAAFCLFYVGRRLLPKAYWFELGILNYGMSTATTAQGILLLRIVDPDLKSGAAEDYAVAAPMTAPFIGGGILTVVGIPLLLQWFVTHGLSIGFVAVGLWAVVIGLYFVGRSLARGGGGDSGGRSVTSVDAG